MSPVSHYKEGLWRGVRVYGASYKGSLYCETVSQTFLEIIRASMSVIVFSAPLVAPIDTLDHVSCC